MNRQSDVAVIVGSLRKDSINRKVANALAELAPATLKLSIIEIGHLPIYNQDGDDNPPAAWTKFRERIRGADAVPFVAPEHNRSVPAALKNAIDIGSRPYGKSAWSSKPGGGGQRIAERHRRVWRQPSRDVARISECSCDGAAGSLSRWCRQVFWHGWQA